MFWTRYVAFATRRFFQAFPNVMMKIPRRQIIYTGGATSFAASLFSTSADLKKNDQLETMTKVREADSYYNMYMIENAYGILRRFRKSNDPELLWRLARVICEQGKMCKNPEEKARLYEEALEIAKKALDNAGESGCFGAHKWYAIILDYASEAKGTKARLVNSYEVKVHLERALEINPLDPTTWMILGMWHFAFADMASYTRLAARAIYATPPSSTYEEALHHFQRADAIQPDFSSSNTFYIAQIYEKLGRKDEAIAEYRKAFAAPVVSVDDNDIHKKANDRLKKLGASSDKK